MVLVRLRTEGLQKRGTLVFLGASRNAVRRSYSTSENKHGRSLPSAVRRRRLHLLQKWRESGLMKPTVPAAPGK